MTLSIQAITVYFFTRPFLTNTLYSVYLTIPTYTSQAISNKYWCKVVHKVISTERHRFHSSDRLCCVIQFPKNQRLHSDWKWHWNAPTKRLVTDKWVIRILEFFCSSLIFLIAKITNMFRNMIHGQATAVALMVSWSESICLESHLNCGLLGPKNTDLENC